MSGYAPPDVWIVLEWVGTRLDMISFVGVYASETEARDVASERIGTRRVVSAPFYALPLAV